MPLLDTNVEKPDILVIDDETSGLRELIDAVERLGFYYHLATGAEDALKRLPELPKVGVVVTDINMPGLDGLSMIEKMHTGGFETRPETIVVTGDPSLERAILAMRLSVSDFLKKPLSLAAFSTAVSRAASRWTEERKQQAVLRDVMESFPEIVSGIFDENEFRQTDSQRPEARSQAGLLAHLSQELNAEFLKRIVQFRQDRGRFFDPELFCDPVWDFLLDLAIADQEGRRTTMTNLCAATNVSYATAFRRINDLADRGIFLREQDVQDRRRIYVSMTPSARTSFFALMQRLVSGPPPTSRSGPSLKQKKKEER